MDDSMRKYYAMEFEMLKEAHFQTSQKIIASPIAIPNEKTMQPLVAVYNPMIKQLKNLYKENRELTKLRDWLLPMLMTRQAIMK